MLDRKRREAALPIAGFVDEILREATLRTAGFVDELLREATLRIATLRTAMLREAILRAPIFRTEACREATLCADARPAIFFDEERRNAYFFTVDFREITFLEARAELRPAFGECLDAVVILLARWAA